MIFRYYVSDDYNGVKKKPWTEMESDSFKDAFDRILELIKWESRVYDTDGGGDDTYYLAIRQGDVYKYYTIEHSFGWDRPSWEDDAEIKNEYDVEEVSYEKIKDQIVSDRDWLTV